MFALIKLVIWVTGAAVVGYFVLQHFGYEVNWNYWDERKAVCQEKITQCRQDLIKKGIDGAKEHCNFQCVDPSLLIRKVEAK